MEKPKTDIHKNFWVQVQDYNSEVFSVFADKDAENPIFEYLNQQNSSLVVADFGCGPGNFLPSLAKHFKSVFAIDYSESLLAACQLRNSCYPNINFKIADLRNLSEYYGKIDIAISVNSILPETVKETDQILQEINKTLTAQGKFVGILPSADVISHLAILDYQKLLSEGSSEQEAQSIVEKKFRENHQTSILGFHRDSPNDPRQKYFFPFEIEWRFRRAGFNSVRMEKVYYSWEYCKNHQYGYHPEYERIWDWFVVAEK